MSPTLTTFLFEAANFLVLAAVLGWLFFKPVRQALADRLAKTESESKHAAEMLAEAKVAQREAAAAHANLQTELNELRTHELEAARRQADQLLADAREAAGRELDMGHRQAARVSETQRDTLARVAATAAAEAVGQLLTQINGPELHSALVQSACQQVRCLTHDSLAPAKVESAVPLTTEQREALDAALGPAATGADYRTVKELGVGIRISTSKGLIDASAIGLAGFARQTLTREMNHHANNHNPMQIANDA